MSETNTARREDALLSSKEVSEWLKVSTPTLCRWRQWGEGPNWVNLSGLIRYRSDDVAAYIEGKVVR